MNNRIKQVERTNYNELIAQLRDRQLILAMAGRYRESYDVAQRINHIKRVQAARARRVGRLCSAT